MAPKVNYAKDVAEEQAIKEKAKAESDTAKLLPGGKNGSSAKTKSSKLVSRATTKNAMMSVGFTKLKVRSSPFTQARTHEHERVDAALADITKILQQAAKLKLQQADVPVSGITTYKGQAIRKNYLTALEACRDFLSEDTKYDGSELDLGITTISWEHSSNASHRVCTVISLTLAVLFIFLAAAFQMWGLQVREAQIALLGAEADPLTKAELEEGLIVKGGGESGDPVEFNLLDFFGWPDHSVMKNMVGGTVLGLIFGFLDNFGLFYGMGALDGVFYYQGSVVCAGIMRLFRRPSMEDSEEADQEFKSIASDMHVVTSDLMAGLGNTFSDFLGVALGTAALEIAKAGLGVEPSFWPLDLFSMVFGCLLGVFLPALIKHQELLGGEKYHATLANFAWSQIFMLFASVFLAGVPYDFGFELSAVCLGTVIFSLIAGMTYTFATGGLIFARAADAISKEVGAQHALGEDD